MDPLSSDEETRPQDTVVLTRKKNKQANAYVSLPGLQALPEELVDPELERVSLLLVTYGHRLSSLKQQELTAAKAQDPEPSLAAFLTYSFSVGIS